MAERRRRPGTVTIFEPVHFTLTLSAVLSADPLGVSAAFDPDTGELEQVTPVRTAICHSSVSIAWESHP